MVKEQGGIQIPIEIAIERYEHGCLVQEYATFCKPSKLVMLPHNLPKYITNEVLNNAPSETEVTKHIREIAQDVPIVGKYASEIAKFANLPNIICDENIMTM